MRSKDPLTAAYTTINHKFNKSNRAELSWVELQILTWRRRSSQFSQVCCGRSGVSSQFGFYLGCFLWFANDPCLLFRRPKQVQLLIIYITISIHYVLFRISSSNITVGSFDRMTPAETFSRIDALTTDDIKAKVYKFWRIDALTTDDIKETVYYKCFNDEDHTLVAVGGIPKLPNYTWFRGCTYTGCDTKWRWDSFDRAIDPESNWIPMLWLTIERKRITRLQYYAPAPLWGTRNTVYKHRKQKP